MIRGLLELQHLHRTTFAEWNGADMGVPDVVSKINITNTLQRLRDSLGWGVKATFFQSSHHTMDRQGLNFTNG